MDKMTKAEMRVAIARDVIAQVNAGRFIVDAGGYVWTADDVRLNGEKQLRDVLRAQRCTVCALGAAFVAAVDRFDKLKCSDVLTHGNGAGARYIDEGTIGPYLRRFFSSAAMARIEVAFEGSGCGGDLSEAADISDAEVGVLNAFCDAYSNDRTRLLAIMQNIIDNGGTFKPGRDARVRALPAPEVG